MPVICEHMKLTALIFVSSQATAAPEIYTGFGTSFTKAGGTDPTLAANQDAITPGVILTRGSTRGIYNIAVEPSFSSGTPADTEWATASSSPGQTIEAANFANLSFTTWAFAFGGKDNLATEILAPGNHAVVHLISEDIYLDLRFTGWDSAGGGGFSYERSTVSIPGDLDGDGDVDGVDISGFFSNFTGPGNGPPVNPSADLDGDDDVDGVDIVQAFGLFTGPLLPGVEVPEPTSLALLGLGGLLMARRRRAA